MDYCTALTHFNQTSDDYEASGDEEGRVLLESLRRRLLKLGLGRQSLKLVVVQEYATAFGLGEVKLHADVRDRSRSRSPLRAEQAVAAVDTAMVKPGEESAVKSGEEA